MTHAVITGGGRGLGAAIATAFDAAGISTTLLGRDLTNLQEVAGRLQAARCQELDVTDPEAMEKCVSDIVSEHQRVDVLINNAGITVQGTRTNKLSKSDWDRVLDINLTSSLNFCRAVLP